MPIDQSLPAPPRVGEHLTVTVERLAIGGDGIAHAGGFTLFIPNSVPGDVLEVEVVQTAKHFGRVRILAVCTPGTDRIPTPCPLADRCAGCQLQQLRYEAQLDAKCMFVSDALQRIGHLSDIDVRPTIGMANPWRYRNKGEFVADRTNGRLRLGYHAEAGKGFIPLSDCPLQHPLSMRILQATEEVAAEEELPLLQLITRVSSDANTALAILVCKDWHDRLPAAAAALRERVPELAGVLFSKVRGHSLVRRTLAESLCGQTTLPQRLGAWDYTVSAESFFQVNNTQGAQLVALVEEFAGDLSNALFADAYCGVGTFLLPLAYKAARSLGIEEHPIAIRDAKTNLAHYAMHDVKLYDARVETVLPRLLRKGRTVDVVVLDPPRKGAGTLVLDSLARLGASRVILVSCDPATLARDAGELTTLGYRTHCVQPVDMFPQTWHVETVALMVR